MAELHVHIISREIAKEKGMTYYFTGNPCKRGGFWERLVSDRSCKCNKCRKNSSEYYYQNKKEIKSKQNIYYNKNREKILKKHKEWREENRDYFNNWKKRHPDYVKNYYETNRSRELERNRLYREKNNEKILRYGREYRKKNPHISRASCAKRLAVKKKRTLSYNEELTDFAFQECQKQAEDMEHEHGFKFHVDHMIPMQAQNVSGLHVWYNLQVIPAKLNHSKKNRLVFTEPLEWLSLISHN